MAGGWAGRPSEQDWADAVRLLTTARDVLLTCHVGPDADALGSALAVGLVLSDLGIPVCVAVGEDPFVLPRSLRGLPGQHLLVPAAQAPLSPAVAVSFDAASADRLGSLEDRVLTAGSFLAVDHHASYSGFAGHHLVDPTAPATAVLALDLVDRLGGPLTSDAAVCLYAGLMTDTMSFRSTSTSPAALRAAARLVEAGARPDAVARAVYDDVQYEALRLLGRALDRARLDERAVDGLGVIRTVVTLEDRVTLGLAMDAAEGVIDVLRTSGEAEVAYVLKEGDDRRWRVSMRSRGAVDVGAVCHALGGGGHPFAAGVTLTGSVPDVIARITATLEACPRPRRR